MKNLIRSILTKLCIYYTVTSLIFLTVILAISGRIEGVISTNSALMFPFSLALALADQLLSCNLPRAARRLLHYVILLLAFYLLLWLPINLKASPTAHFTILLLVSAVYWLILGIIRLTVYRFRSFREE